mmetsp:Transcript_50806/g.110801  ORF Transcript_50806/g.110801 Transcript_50806/m.110801 type:complete len:241 (+) Transcript_50806:145-867(+)
MPMRLKEDCHGGPFVASTMAGRSTNTMLSGMVKSSRHDLQRLSHLEEDAFANSIWFSDLDYLALPVFHIQANFWIRASQLLTSAIQEDPRQKDGEQPRVLVGRRPHAFEGSALFCGLVLVVANEPALVVALLSWRNQPLQGARSIVRMHLATAPIHSCSQAPSHFNKLHGSFASQWSQIGQVLVRPQVRRVESRVSSYSNWQAFSWIVNRRVEVKPCAVAIHTFGIVVDIQGAAFAYCIL